MTRGAPCPRSEDNAASATKDSRGWQPLPRDHLCLFEGYQPRHSVLDILPQAHTELRGDMFPTSSG